MNGSVPEHSARAQEATQARVVAAPPIPLLRRRWVAPAAVVGAGGLALIASGVIPLASLASFAPLAGCALMMVFMHGAGGHGGHGAPSAHAGHGGEHGTVPQQGQGVSGNETDPVCGMRVDPAVALPQGFASRHHDKDVVFCSRGCRDSFDADPSRYLTA